MANTNYGNGTNYAKTLDPSSANILDPGLIGGKVRVMQDTATISASANLNSQSYIIVGGKLPTGAQVVSVMLNAPGTTALGTQTNVSVGDEGDHDRYISNVYTSTAACWVNNVATGYNYAVTGTTDNYIRITGHDAGTRVSTNTLKITVFYVVE